MVDYTINYDNLVKTLKRGSGIEMAQSFADAREKRIANVGSLGAPLTKEQVKAASPAGAILNSYKEAKIQDEKLQELRKQIKEEADKEEKILSGKIVRYSKGITKEMITQIITEESNLRKIDPSVAIRLYKAEGFNSYQSTIPRTGEGSLNGMEASFGPFQLFTGGGMGNDYETDTNRKLVNDNTIEGITKQIQYALDKAVQGGWKPWSGAKVAGIGEREGLGNAIVIGNWKETGEN